MLRVATMASGRAGECSLTVCIERVPQLSASQAMLPASSCAIRRHGNTRTLAAASSSAGGRASVAAPIARSAAHSSRGSCCP